jgi:indolepyruvate ferredoxin oxidoreductase, beta subunit
MKLDILVTGVGGQGNILASDIIGEVAIEAGFDVKKTDTLGMAQRGGSVLSNLRIAEHVYSPLIQEGEVDILLAFEKLEAARWANYLRSGATVIVNNQSVPPLSVILGNDKYPEDEKIVNLLKQKTGDIYFIEAARRAKELGNARTLNIFMLGCVSSFMPFKVESWKDRLSEHLPPNLRPVNLIAFDAGRKEIKDARIR